MNLDAVKVKLNTAENRVRIAKMAQAVRRVEKDAGQKPVVFFNASTRIYGMSLNAAFQELVAWSLGMDGVRVVQFACRQGMKRCVLGLDLNDLNKAMPCEACVAQSERLVAGADEVVWLEDGFDGDLAKRLKTMDLDKLSEVVVDDVAYGAMVLPSVRWRLRRHNLMNDADTKGVFVDFLVSAVAIGRQAEKALAKINPAAVVVFNGTSYPEAVVRYFAEKQGVRVITHEVGFEPFSGFFVAGEATAYPTAMPDDFALNETQRETMNAYLKKRFQGDFTMAGITFWKDIQGLDEELLAKIDQHDALVPVFTNVIFDTSQMHANVIYEDMFAWLDDVKTVIEAQPETLFVIRAHPDELRAGKRSQESVADWVDEQGLLERENVIFINSDEFVSSYALMAKAKFVMVYNSSIGLEASLMRVPVVSAGASRYTAYETVFVPESRDAHLKMVGKFLKEKIDVQDGFYENALRYVFYQNHHISQSFADFLKAHPTDGYVVLKGFAPEALKAVNSPVLTRIQNGILKGDSFERSVELQEQ